MSELVDQYCEAYRELHGADPADRELIASLGATIASLCGRMVFQERRDANNLLAQQGFLGDTQGEHQEVIRALNESHL